MAEKTRTLGTTLEVSDKKGENWQKIVAIQWDESGNMKYLKRSDFEKQETKSAKKP